MIKAQERILEKFKPKNKIAFVSLCTSTRPYSKSRKWKQFKNSFKNVDFIISSNGGVIPIEYEDAYPYMTYDAHGQKQYDELYIIYTSRNLIRFFTLKKYNYVMFNFRPTLRNHKAGKLAGKYLKNKKHIKNYYICPDLNIYEMARKDGFSKLGLSMYPDIHPIILNDMKDKIERLVE